ncbi:hypothetical protein M758_9G189600 [Ceratodon purpureus]|nr:hypothetical protein M758_9G189600 [Ceratodon purpureus]
MLRRSLLTAYAIFDNMGLVNTLQRWFLKLLYLFPSTHYSSLLTFMTQFPLMKRLSS